MAHPDGRVRRGETAVDEDLLRRYHAGYRDLALLEAELEGWTDMGAWPED